MLDEILRLNPNNVKRANFPGTPWPPRKIYEAEAEYTNALQLKPDDAVIHKALAIATESSGRQALTNLYSNLKILPTPEIHAQIAVILTTQGEFGMRGHYLEALRLKPDAPEVLNNLAWLLATCPDATSATAPKP